MIHTTLPLRRMCQFSAIQRLLGGLCLLAALAWPGLRPAAGDEPAIRTVTEKDMPRIPHTEPDRALETFKLAKGCRLEMVASEPLVADPVDACFDEQGRMYVAEMHGYPFSQEPTKLNPQGGGKKDAGIIRLLEDTDGDGRMDQSYVFADQISWPTSVCCYNGGVFVLAPQYLYYFKDTDGDHKADVREVVLSGFGRDNIQSVANNLKWGLDNQIYFAAGRNPLRLEHRGKPLEAPQGSDLRFDPRTEKFEPVTGGQQYGHSMDDWGNRFVCSNSNHVQQVIYPREYLARNPYLAVSGLVRSIAADGASAPVFRSSPPEPWRIVRQRWRAAEKGYRLVINKDGAWEFLPLDPSKKKGAVPTEYPEGYFTSATGITIYRGGAWPEEFRGNAFVGDVGGNLVHRKRLVPRGVSFVAERADEGEELIRSSDNWFRPVNFVNAPDGTLYVLDMYRETVEHPFSIPEEIKKFLHLYSGSDRGRVYRIVTPGMERVRPQSLAAKSAAELVKELESPNSWNRETAQRLLWERQDKSAVAPLRAVAVDSAGPLGRLHALHTLAGLDSLDAATLRRATADASPHVREHAIRLSEPLLKGDSELARAVIARTADDADRVRFQTAFSLGECSEDDCLAGLKLLAADRRNGEEIRTALMSSAAGVAGSLARQLLSDEGFLKQPHAGSFLSELGLIIGAQPGARPAAQALDALSQLPDTHLQLQSRLLAALGEGLARRGANLSSVLADPETSPEIRRQVERLFQTALESAGDERLPVGRRVQAIGLLAFAEFKFVAPQMAEFLSPQAPQAVQRAAVLAVGKLNEPEAGKLLIAQWKTFGPDVRRDAVDALTRTDARVDMLLDALDAERIRPGELQRDTKQRLLTHPQAAIRGRSKELFGGEVNPDRAKVVAEFQPALELEADAARGRGIFEKKCSVCHRVGDTGYAVAPDLNSVKNKSESDLLIALLDPNREAQPNFNTYVVRTDSGQVFAGIIASESDSSITLRRAEAKEDVILRSTIELLQSTGVSLMPEGLEKDLSRQDVADVIAFIKGIKEAPKGSKEGPPQ